MSKAGGQIEELIERAFESPLINIYPKTREQYAADHILTAISKGEIEGVVVLGGRDKLLEAACGAFNFIRGLSDDGAFDKEPLHGISSDVLKEPKR